MVAFVSAAFLTLVTVAEPRTTVRSPARDVRTGHWVAFTVLMALATYSSYVAVLVIPAQLLVVLPLAPAARRCGRSWSRSPSTRCCCVPLFVLARAAWLRPAVLGPAADAQDRAAGARGADLRRSAAELSPHLDDDPAAGDHRRGGDRGRGLGVCACCCAARASLGTGRRARVVRRAGRDHVRLLAGRPAAVPAAQRADVGRPGRAAAGRRDRAPRVPRLATRRGAGGAGRAARAAARAKLRRLAGAVAAGDRLRSGSRAARRLHRLLPARRQDGVPVLHRHRQAGRPARPALDPAERAVGRGQALRRALRHSLSGPGQDASRRLPAAVVRLQPRGPDRWPRAVARQPRPLPRAPGQARASVRPRTRGAARLRRGDPHPAAAAGVRGGA